MARPLRIEFPGAWYHVMNRGLCRREVFHAEDYALLFYNLLAETHQRYKIEIHAFCLMGNHYHLCIRTPLANLGQAMRHINSMFTRIYNRLIDGDGPLFRGRYKAILIDKENYFLRLTRYIHLNPVAAGIVQCPKEYRWSSYPYLFNRQKKPTWLYFEEILKFFDPSNPILDYEKFVSDAVDLELKSFFNSKKIFPILGTTSFIEKIKNRIPQLSLKEVPDATQVIQYNGNHNPIEIENIIDAVAKYYNINHESILTFNKSNDLARQVAIYLSVVLSEKPQETIAKFFKKITRFGISKIYCRIRLDIQKNISLSLDIDNIKRSLFKN